MNFEPAEQSLFVGPEFSEELEPNNGVYSSESISSSVEIEASSSPDEIIVNQVPLDVINTLETGEPVQLIVEYKTDEIDAAVNAQRQAAGLSSTEPNTTDITEFKAQAYQALESEVLSSLSEVEVLKDYSHLPLNFVEVSSTEALNELLANPDVVQVYENNVQVLTTDRSINGDEREISLDETDSDSTEASEVDEEILTPQLAQSLPQINQPIAVENGYTGDGTTVAVLDTGADPNAPGLSGRIVSSQEFADNDGSADDNGHGTNVSAIAAGVAPDTGIAALDVFTFFPGSGHGAYDSDIIEAINWSIDNQDTYNIVAMNMSLGGGRYYSPITSNSSYLTPVQNAKDAGILTIAASGNDGWSDSMGGPAAVEGIVSVGAVNDSDTVASFSNSANFLDLLAPGVSITAGGFTLSGTSMATPHVSGAVAVLAAADPSDSPDDIVNTLKNTGVSITDSRNGLDFPRIDIGAALGLTEPPSPIDVDLSGAYFDVVQQSLEAGDSFDVEFEIQNTEADDANGFSAGFYLSEDATIDNSAGSDDIPLESELISSLAGNSTTGILSASLTLPNAFDSFWNGDGTYYIGVISDAFGNVAETDETNNASTGELTDYESIEITVGISDDNYEENDDLGSAYYPGYDWEDTWLSSIDGEGIVNDDDWYDIDVSSGEEHLHVDLVSSDVDGDIDLELYDDNGNFLAGSYSSSNNESIDYTVPESGIYYLKVYPYSGSGVTYDLWWDDIAIDDDDDNYEENDDLGSAYYPGFDWEDTWLSSIDGEGIVNDDDWYDIDVSSGEERLIVDLVSSDVDGDIDLELYDNNGNYLTGSTSSSNNESIDYTVPEDGIYYLRVFPFSGSGVTYDLWWDDISTDINTVDNDFDGDGKADIHWRNGSDNQVWLMDGTTRLAQGNLSSTSWNAEGNGDFNGDGVADLLFTNGSQYEIWEMDGTTEVNTYSFTALDSNWSVVGIGDTDGDGDDDILARNGNANRILEIDNFDLANVVTLNNYNSSWSVAGVGDTDGDGDADILWRKGSGNRIWEIENNGRESVTNIGGYNANWSVSGLGDTDGDGDDDIVWRKGNANRIWELENNDRVSNLNLGGFNSAWQVEDIEDYDGDGDDDILFRKGNKNKIWEIDSNSVVSKTNTNNLNAAWELIG